MLRTVVLILFVLSAFNSFSQKLALASFKRFTSANFNEQVWYVASLKQHFTDFVSYSESSNWTTKAVIHAVGLKKGKAFLVRLTSSISDTPENKITEMPLELSKANQFLDSLRLLCFYKLKDESQIVNCQSKKDTIIDGRKAVTIESTKLTEDGSQTTFVVYSKGRFRVTRYYELPASSSICPEIGDWKMALQVRNYLQSFFNK